MKNKNYNHEYYLKNKAKLLVRAKEYRAKHPEQVVMWHKAWAERNPEVVLDNKRKWRIRHKVITPKSVQSAINVLEAILLTIKN